jgi:hypothetical protein
MLRKLTVLAAAAAILLTATACDDNEAVDSERKTVNDTQSSLIASQPAHPMTYSPTRATKNFWIDTWGTDPNKLSYVYMQNAQGELFNSYVFKGLPVSYCNSLVPTFDVDSDANGKVTTPRPSMDGTYPSGSGACSTFYGQDAATGGYVEYTVGLGINVFLFDRPLPNRNVPKLVP